MKKRIIAVMMLLCSTSSVFSEEIDITKHGNAMCYLIVLGEANSQPDVKKRKKLEKEADIFLNSFLHQGYSRQNFYDVMLEVKPAIESATSDRLMETQNICHQFAEYEKNNAIQNTSKKSEERIPMTRQEISDASSLAAKYFFAARDSENISDYCLYSGKGLAEARKIDSRDVPEEAKASFTKAMDLFKKAERDFNQNCK
ncbi:MAG: hypothetical protein WBI40_04070 [Methylococcaceae bacterium]